MSTLCRSRLLAEPPTRVSMPPRRSARLVELANPHFQLPFPPNVVALLFSLLPLDARLLAREVCRGWRLFLEDFSFWQSLDFSAAAAERLTVALTWGLVRAACARAKGTLHTLKLQGRREVPFAALEELVAENGESLRSLMMPTTLILDAADVGRLRQAAPLCELSCNVQCEGAEAVALMRCELVCPFFLTVKNLDTEQLQTDFASTLATHTGIKGLLLLGGNLADAVLNLSLAVVAAGVESIGFGHCGLTPMALPALTLLLRSEVLHCFILSNHGVLLTGPDLLAFCDALRSNSSLYHIMLNNGNLWADPADAGMVLAALAARTTPFTLGLDGNRVGETQAQQLAAGTQLAQLITAGGLEELNLNDCNLGEAGLVPIFETLPRASRLMCLAFGGDELSPEFARDVLLPAVRANNSLRSLNFRYEDEGELLPELIEAQNIVEARN